MKVNLIEQCGNFFQTFPKPTATQFVTSTVKLQRKFQIDGKIQM